MSADNHPILDRMLKGHHGAPIEDRDAFFEQASLELALYSAPQRAAMIDALDREIENDTGTLRERSQLLSLRRTLSNSDSVLKASGR